MSIVNICGRQCTRNQMMSQGNMQYFSMMRINSEMSGPRQESGGLMDTCRLSTILSKTQQLSLCH